MYCTAVERRFFQLIQRSARIPVMFICQRRTRVVEPVGGESGAVSIFTEAWFDASMTVVPSSASMISEAFAKIRLLPSAGEPPILFTFSEAMTGYPRRVPPSPVIVGKEGC